MKLVVISPESSPANEIAVLGALFAAGLERYHVRKPAWSRARLEAWLRAVPVEWRPRLVLHSHHDLARALGVGGVHWRDEVGRVLPHPPAQPAEDRPAWLSASCHDLPALRGALGRCDSVFLGPIFPSLSKRGYGPRGAWAPAELAALLAGRSAAERRTSVLALGGVTIDRIPQVRALGFDGAAVLGAVWQAPDPVAAFSALQDSLCCHAA